jgi:hypothetical protein
MLSVDKSVVKIKLSFLNKTNELDKVHHGLEDQVHKINNFLSRLENEAKMSRDKIADVYV